jgi:hypothetical protein
VGDTDCVPLAAFAPVQPLLAVHDVALVELQLSVADEPATTLAGEALIETVGAGAAALTVTVVLCVAEPLVPVHVKM